MHDKLTKVDIKKMQEEIEHRTKELRPKLLEEVKRTREYGDLSENAEYKEAKRVCLKGRGLERYEIAIEVGWRWCGWSRMLERTL